MGGLSKIDTTLLRWRVNYIDGTVLWEIDPKTRKENIFSDIQLNKVQSVDLLLPIDKMEDVLLAETDIRVGTLDDKPAIMTLKVYNQSSLPFFHLELPPNAQFIWARRTQMSRGQKIAVVPTKNPNQPIKIPFPVPKGGKIIIIGWKQKIGGQNVQALNYLYPNGQIQSDYQWRKDADHGKVDMPGDVPDGSMNISIDANLIAKKNESSSTTKVGEESEPRAGIPDDVIN